MDGTTLKKSSLRRAARQLSNYQGTANYAYVVDVIEYEQKSGFHSFSPTTTEDQTLLHTQQQQLRTALETLGFHIPAAGYVTGNVTKQQMKDFLLQLCSAVFPSNVGCVLVVVSGHGLEGRFYTSDSHPFGLDTIKYSLASNESLREKVKWFIFGSCRGDSDHVTENATHSVADAAWWRPTSVHIMRDIVSTFAAPDHYSTYGRDFFDSFVHVVKDLVVTERNNIEIAELLRMLCREASDSSTGLMKKDAEVTMSLVAQLRLPVNENCSTTLQFMDNPLAVTSHERNTRQYQLDDIGEEQMTDAENWEYRCLSAGKANRAALIQLLKKEADAFEQADVSRSQKMESRRRSVSSAAEMFSVVE